MKVILNGYEVTKETLYIVSELTATEGMTSTDSKEISKANLLFSTRDNCEVKIFVNKLQFAFIFVSRGKEIIFSGYIGAIHLEKFWFTIYKIRRYVLVNEFSRLPDSFNFTLLDLFYKDRRSNNVWDEYYSQYGFDKIDAKHSLIKIDGKKNKLFVHVLHPTTQSAFTPHYVLVSHGVLDHSGSNIQLVNFLVENGFTPVLYDLPGHGISDGERWDISDFSIYAYAVYDVMKWMMKKCKGEYSFIGHSTGTVGITEGLLNPTFSKSFTKMMKNFSNICFIAPVIRTYLWNFSKFSIKNLGGFFKMIFDEKLPRLADKATGDKKYNEQSRNDLLSGKYTPVSWTRALIAWNERNIQYIKSDLKITVFQGEHDEVVDFPYNIPYLENHFKQVEVIRIKKAKHSLQNENGKAGESFYNNLKSVLIRYK